MDLTNDLTTTDLFQNFPLKSKKIDNDHFLLLKATIFLTLPGLPMPSAMRASFIHKSLLLRLPCVGLRIACEQAFGRAGNYFFPQTESLFTG